MILPNMTPQEKLSQMEKIFPFVKSIAERMSESRFFANLKRAGRYPAYLFVKDREIGGFGKWTIVLEVASKGNACKGMFTVMAFQTFHVSRSKNPLNNGIGIYLLNPQQSGDKWCCEMPPHYFNRMRERLIGERGIVQPDFYGLVKEVLRMNHHSMNVINEGVVVKKGEDGLYETVKDPERQRQAGYDNFVSYHKSGISLGISKDRKYFLYTTFVSNDLLRNGQQDMQRENLREAGNHEIEMRYDPKSIFMKEQIVDKADF